MELLYAALPQDSYLDAAMNTILQIHLEQEPGDVLVFLTGQEEIDSLQQLLKHRYMHSRQLWPACLLLLICCCISALALRRAHCQQHALASIIASTHLLGFRLKLTFEVLKFHHGCEGFKFWHM